MFLQISCRNFLKSGQLIVITRAVGDESRIRLCYFSFCFFFGGGEGGGVGCDYVMIGFFPVI